MDGWHGRQEDWTYCSRQWLKTSLGLVSVPLSAYFLLDPVVARGHIDATRTLSPALCCCGRMHQNIIALCPGLERMSQYSTTRLTVIIENLLLIIVSACGCSARRASNLLLSPVRTQALNVLVREHADTQSL